MGTMPTSRAASRAWSIATSTSAGRPRPVCASRRRRSARIAGSRSPTAGPVDGGARGRERVGPAHVGDRAAARARARADRGDDRVRRDLQARAERVGGRHPGRLHPAALLDRARSCCCRSRSAPAGAVRRRRASRCACKDFVLAVLAFGVVGFAGYWFQNAGLNARRRRTPRSSPDCSSCSRRSSRPRSRGGARRCNVVIAVGVRGRRPVLARGLDVAVARRRRAHARVRGPASRLDPAGCRTSRSTSIRSRSPPVSSWCSRCSRSRSSRSAGSVTSPDAVSSSRPRSPACAAARSRSRCSSGGSASSSRAGPR